MRSPRRAARFGATESIPLFRQLSSSTVHPLLDVPTPVDDAWPVRVAQPLGLLVVGLCQAERQVRQLVDVHECGLFGVVGDHQLVGEEVGDGRELEWREWCEILKK